MASVGLIARQRRALRPTAARWRRRGVIVQLDLGARGPAAAGLQRISRESYWARAARCMPAAVSVLRIRAPRPVPEAA